MLRPPSSYVLPFIERPFPFRIFPSSPRLLTKRAERQILLRLFPSLLAIRLYRMIFFFCLRAQFSPRLARSPSQTSLYQAATSAFSRCSRKDLSFSFLLICWMGPSFSTTFVLGAPLPYPSLLPFFFCLSATTSFLLGSFADEPFLQVVWSRLQCATLFFPLCYAFALSRPAFLLVLPSRFFFLFFPTFFLIFALFQFFSLGLVIVYLALLPRAFYLFVMTLLPRLPFYPPPPPPPFLFFSACSLSHYLANSPPLYSMVALPLTEVI